MKPPPALSIRNVLIGLSCLSVLGLIGLAALGIMGTQRQADTLDRVMVLERALHNHNDADAFMDNIRADVLRALQAAVSVNREGPDAIRADFLHHVDVVQKAAEGNRELPLEPDVLARYARVAGLMETFLAAGHVAVELALSDPVAGGAYFEKFRHNFSALETEMDALRDILRSSVEEVRAESHRTMALVLHGISGAAVFGAIVLFVVATIAVGTVQGITIDLAQSREHAQHLALHDVLTGLPNRFLLSERLESALAQLRPEGEGVAVLSLDLDRFKSVNDTLGHPIGDALLRAVASRLLNCVREGDTVARLGGDEFAIVQSASSGPLQAGALAARLVDALAAPYTLDGHRVQIGASVGYALAGPELTNKTELLKMADIALYRAKANGRGTYAAFEAGMDAEQRHRRGLEEDLSAALAGHQFELHYQPLVNLGTGRVAAVEALLRWNHPIRGRVMPMEFIPLLEETGQITEVGAWVLQQACQDAVAWPEEIRVAVNLSAMQFRGPGLAEAVASALTRSGLTPQRLELEITETALLHDGTMTLGILHDLRAQGVRIAMDDFGTGYSALGYLRRFLFDRIKIDQCFIREIETSADCKAIIRAVAGLGANLGIEVTAEGIETQDQLERVQEEGCNEAQGFLFSRPVPSREVAALLLSIRPAPVRDAAVRLEPALARS